jgi:hypothetical protein
MSGLQASFGTVLWIVTGLSFVAAVFALATSGRQWREFGREHLVMDSEAARTGEATGSSASIRERDEEIRELLEARNERRRRRGEATVDVEAELRRLTSPLIDADLRAEIRDLVIARNHRRARAGKPPLDVEAEIEREIAGLTEWSPS